MSEIQIIPGKHRCGITLDLRIVNMEKESAWIIYGICKKCDVILVLDLLMQEKEPVEGVDFIIQADQIAEEADEPDAK